MYNKPEATFMKRRNWSADEKLAIVLEGIKEKRLVAEICQECCIPGDIVQIGHFVLCTL